MITLLASSSFIACSQTNTQNTNENKKTITTNSKPTAMQDENLLKPVKTLIEAMEVENATLIRKQFAKIATQAYGADGEMKTPEATAKWIETDIIGRQGKVSQPEFTVENGNQVIVKGQYSSQGYSNKANFLFTVEDGLITSWRMRY